MVFSLPSPIPAGDSIEIEDDSLDSNSSDEPNKESDTQPVVVEDKKDKADPEEAEKKAYAEIKPRVTRPASGEDKSRPVSQASNNENRNSARPESANRISVKDMLTPFKRNSSNRPVSEALVLKNLDEATKTDFKEDAEKTEDQPNEEDDDEPKSRAFRLPSIYLKDIGPLSSDEYLTKKIEIFIFIL
jgi:hypothetical protein